MNTKGKACMILLLGIGFVTAGCKDGDEVPPGAFPEFRDMNGNAINDHVEAGTHFVAIRDPRRHDFVDSDGDGVCDLAQIDDSVWHGPGYIDGDGDGVSDYWDHDMPQYQRGWRDLVHGSDFVVAAPQDGRHRQQGLRVHAEE